MLLLFVPTCSGHSKHFTNRNWRLKHTRCDLSHDVSVADEHTNLLFTCCFRKLQPVVITHLVHGLNLPSLPPVAAVCQGLARFNGKFRIAGGCDSLSASRQSYAGHDFVHLTISASSSDVYLNQELPMHCICELVAKFCSCNSEL